MRRYIRDISPYTERTPPDFGKYRDYDISLLYPDIHIISPKYTVFRRESFPDERVRTVVAMTCEDHGCAHNSSMLACSWPCLQCLCMSSRNVARSAVFCRCTRPGHSNVGYGMGTSPRPSLELLAASIASRRRLVVIVCRDVTPALCYESALNLKARARGRALTYRFRKNERPTAAGQ